MLKRGVMTLVTCLVAHLSRRLKDPPTISLRCGLPIQKTETGCDEFFLCLHAGTRFP